MLTKSQRTDDFFLIFLHNSDNLFRNPFGWILPDLVWFVTGNTYTYLHIHMHIYVHISQHSSASAEI